MKKTAIVTGGSKGIGLEVVKRLIEQGVQVITCSRNKAHWLEQCEALPELKSVDYLALDISIESQLRDFFDYVERQYGQLDFAINNASPAIGSLGEFGSVALDDLKNTLDVDFWSQAYCLKREISLMGSGGAIVNVSSVNGIRPTPNAAMYSAAKHALEGLTRSVALETISKGIRINAVAPGVTWTPRWQEREREDPGIRERVNDAVPLKRFAHTGEVVDAIEFLLSDKASYIVGHTLVIDGGLSLA
ncbi:dehydrogenase [Vibrio variabilis]|uniref:Dehydrogenase n=1 Tax=Vibrio variabilis TaxID=990271 RepID=A0ABR4Y6I2_9VIBR|nr:SDR family oxidoreductase [Vibrio variabilis]KHA59069.1 dehydrogenase [Vibrio variabilis]